MTSRLPKLVAFDLEYVVPDDIGKGLVNCIVGCQPHRRYTLWDLWIDTHVTPPLKSVGINSVWDKHGQEVEFYRDVPEILHRLREAGVVIAACSRTSAPRLARQALSLLLVPPQVGDKSSPPKPAIQFFDQLEIYPGSKLAHFKKLHEKTGLPYSEMLFFDDERRNKEVESLGVTFCLVQHGTDDRTFEHGLTTWRKRHAKEVIEDADGTA